MTLASALICISAGLAAAASIGAALRMRDRRAERDATGLPILLRLCHAPALLITDARVIRWPAEWLRHVERQLARANLLDSFDAPLWTNLLMAQLVIGIGTAVLIGISLEGIALPILLTSGLLPAACSQSWIRARGKSRCSSLMRALPSALDLLVLCLESGASLGTALRITHDKSPPGALRDLLGALLARMRAGVGRADACRHIISLFDLAPVTGLLTALIQAETRGMSLGPALRAQAAQCVTDRFVRAERAAMQAPVKLLLPLLAFIFPCTFIVIAIPIAARLTGQGGP